MEEKMIAVFSLVKRGKNKESISYLKELIAEEPQNSLLLAYYAISLERTTAYDQAEQIIQEAKKIPGSEKCAELLVAEGMLMIAKDGNNREALRKLSEAVTLKPDSPFILGRKAYVQSSLGDEKGAIEDYSKAIEIDPEYSLAWSNRGRAKMDLGDEKGAIEDYSKAIEIDPENVFAWDNRGFARMALGDKKGAIEDFDKVIEIDPGDVYARNNRGYARMNLGDKKGAIEDFDKVIEINPTDVYAWSNRGTAKLDLGDKKGAIQDYSKAIEINPMDVYAWNERGNAKMELGDKQGAIEDFDKAIEIDPGDSMAFTNKALVYRDLEMYENMFQYQYLGIRLIKDRELGKYTSEKEQAWMDAVDNYYKSKLKKAFDSQKEVEIVYFPVHLNYGSKDGITRLLADPGIYKSLEGSYGSGFICVTNLGVWIISINVVTKRNKPTFGFLAGALTQTFDRRSPIQGDHHWFIPYSEILGVQKSVERGQLEEILLRTTTGTWEVNPHFDHVERILASVRAGKNGKYSEWKEMPKTVNTQSNSREEIMNQLKQLKELFDLEVLNREEYEQKRSEWIDELNKN